MRPKEGCRGAPDETMRPITPAADPLDGGRQAQQCGPHVALGRCSSVGGRPHKKSSESWYTSRGRWRSTSRPSTAAGPASAPRPLRAASPGNSPTYGRQVPPPISVPPMLSSQGVVRVSRTRWPRAPAIMSVSAPDEAPETPATRRDKRLPATLSTAGGILSAAMAAAALSTVIGEPVSSRAGMVTPLTVSVSTRRPESGSRVIPAALSPRTTCSIPCASANMVIDASSAAVGPQRSSKPPGNAVRK
eukprot:scaffold65962_cov25-Tisochrysis_lutea.AAC.5